MSKPVNLKKIKTTCQSSWAYQPVYELESTSEVPTVSSVRLGGP